MNDGRFDRSRTNNGSARNVYIHLLPHTRLYQPIRRE